MINPRRSNSAKTVFWAGLLAGCLDLAAAIITTMVRGGRPSRMFQAIASGVLGANSFQGGSRTAALGIFLHFVIALIWATVYYLASRRLSFLVSQAVIFGVLYGVIVYFFMQWVVLPLSAVLFRPSLRPSVLITGVLVHIFCVGLPIALTVRRLSAPAEAPAVR